MIGSAAIGPWFAFTPDGTKIYSTKNPPSSIFVTDVATNTIEAEIPVGEHPTGVAIANVPDDAVNTPPGNDVVTQPSDITTGTTPVTLTFSSVIQGGITTLNTSASGPVPPSRFQLGDPPTYYDIATTAVFSGPVEVCIDYNGINFIDEATLGLFHFDGNQWIEVTTSLDATNKIICGSVTSLSPFAVFEVRPFQFSGFLQPVDNPPTINVAKAGSAIPVRFSLGGDQGLNIFETGYPKSQAINCDTTSPIDVLEEIVTAGSSSLSYNAGTDRYTYVWKTNRSWANSCRQLIVKLTDGSSHVAYFKFR